MEIPGIIKTFIKKSGVPLAYHKLNKWQKAKYRQFLYTVSPVMYVKQRYADIYGEKPNLNEPETLSEKLVWMMLFWMHPLKIECADKFTMRSYVEKQGWRHVLPELLGVYKHSSEINFDALPDKFVLKCNHGCGFNIICENKAELDIEQARLKLDKWMATDYSKVAGEVHYTFMKPRIICEQFLEDPCNQLPTDYKVYCFNGKAHCTIAVKDRSLNGHSEVWDFYDVDWQTKLPYGRSSLQSDRKVPKPAAYNEIIEAAEALSKPFPFVRMDFYDINGKAYLGEMTFTPGGCINREFTEVAQRVMGGLIVLPPPVEYQSAP